MVVRISVRVRVIGIVIFRVKVIVGLLVGWLWLVLGLLFRLLLWL